MEDWHLCDDITRKTRTYKLQCCWSVGSRDPLASVKARTRYHLLATLCKQEVQGGVGQATTSACYEEILADKWSQLTHKLMAGSLGRTWESEGMSSGNCSRCLSTTYLGLAQGDSALPMATVLLHSGNRFASP